MGVEPAGSRLSGGRLLRSPDEVGSDYSVVVISPHFDDAALGLGAVLARERRLGRRPLVVDVCTARPPDSGLSAFARFQHEMWGGGSPWLEREAEESAAMARLGADHLWLGLPDAIYRGDLYADEESLFGALRAEDGPTIAGLAKVLADLTARWRPATTYAPLAVGGHVDHRLVRAAALKASKRGGDLRLYADVPYCLVPGASESALQALGLEASPADEEVLPVDLEAKVAAVGLYRSQADWIFRNYGPVGDCLHRLAAGGARGPGVLTEQCWRVQPSGPR